MIPINTIWLFSALTYYFMAPHYPHPPLLQYMYITFHAETLSVKNGEAKQSRIIPGSEYMNRLVTTRFDIRMHQGFTQNNTVDTL